MKFQLPFVLRSHHDADVAALNAELEDVSEKHTDTAIVNECLTEDLTKAREQIAEYGGRRTVADVLEEHDVHRKALADALGDQNRHMNWDQLIAEVAGWVKAANAWMADCAAEKKRADSLCQHSEVGRLQRRLDLLQKRYDDAVGLKPGGIADSSCWQPGYKDSKEASS